MSLEQYPDVVMPECPAEKILEGQKALVTGGASGIGRAVAIALGQASRVLDAWRVGLREDETPAICVEPVDQRPLSADETLP